MSPNATRQVPDESGLAGDRGQKQADRAELDIGDGAGLGREYERLARVPSELPDAHLPVASPRSEQIIVPAEGPPTE